jgi:hypothetical protein
MPSSTTWFGSVSSTSHVVVVVVVVVFVFVDVVWLELLFCRGKAIATSVLK